MNNGIQRFSCPKCYSTGTSGSWDMATARKYNVGVKDIEPIQDGFGDFFSQFICPSCGATIAGDQLILRNEENQDRL
jgi:predicted RNA-binding Zn-ribbon protein involved in translation (DUF1610 family)